MSDPKRAPVQGDYWLPRGTRGREPGSISWAEHLEAWSAYSKRYRADQSAETVAARGGFGFEELSALLGHAPTTFEEVTP